ncbi:TonB-dependent receptor plug domain-containing protein [Colwellia sp. 12G3]|uniref:TonB-dependent receptor plug domain-containing protein n=1 Tax=Colwellia sp. 12G3 TaxID=2058299 RepID=UPI0018E3977A|nr:TonB-dependent receptor [Colwellia sp. 12G3]
MLLNSLVCVGQESVFDLTLEQLSRVNVSVSSKVDLPLNLSPATVSTYSHEQLFQQGIHQLADLADISPGYSSYSIYGERIFETRGQKSGSFENNKHLVLLDGIRINHVRANKAPVENELPLWMLSKLELLRGPASALYGQSAFLGVTSLNSAFNSDNDFSAQASYQNTSKGIRANLKGNLHSQFGHSYLAYSHYQNESDDALVGPILSPMQKYYDDQNSEFIYARQHAKTDRLGNFTLGYIELNRQSGLGEHWTGDFSDIENEIDWTTKISYLSWQQQFGEDVNVAIKIVNNDSTEQGVSSNENRMQISQGDTVTYSRYRVKVNAQLVEGEINWHIADQQSLIFGASIEERQEQGDYFATGFNQSNLSQPPYDLPSVDYFPRTDSAIKTNQGVYFQYYDLLSSLADIHLTAGIRFDKGEYLTDSFSQWSPRIALVKVLNPQWTLKASYSSAFRAPSLKEYLLNTEAIELINQEAQNPEKVLARLPNHLLAETIDSTELSISYQQNNFLIKINNFYNHTENLLNGQPVFFVNKNDNISSQNTFVNLSQDYSVYGAEVELQWRFAQNWQLNSFISQVIPKEDSKEATIDIAKFKSNLSLTGIFSWFTVNLMQLYHSDFNGELDYISRFDITFSRQNNMKNDYISTYLKISNVFNQHYYHSIDGELGNPLPGRAIEIGLSYQF